MTINALPALVRICLIAALFFSLLAAGQPFVAAQESTPAPAAPFMGETFVGETSDPETLVAIILGDEAAGARPARGYLCNGPLRTIDVWLAGEARDGQVTLTAEDGSQLTGVLNPAGIGGAATLGSGESFLFAAAPATGLAGLYTVEMLANGRMEGGSAEGATLVGALQGDASAGSAPFRYDVQITLPDGSEETLTISTPTADEASFRAIVLPSGEGIGQGKSKRKGDWVEPDVEP